MSTYPTPPPTSSPKATTYHPYSPKLPAQETYYQDSYSTPTSPKPWDAPSNSKPSQALIQGSHEPQDLQAINYEYEYRPPRRSSSPTQTQRPPTSIAPPAIPPRRRSTPTATSHNGRTSPFRKQSPRPLYYSPTNPIPTPYNVSRPQPRPGFLHRMLNKITKWIRSFVKWCKENPIKAGLLTFLPVLAGVGIAKFVQGISKIGREVMEGMGGGPFPSKKEVKEKLEKEGKKVEKEIEKEWGWGMDEFIGFGGSKGHPLDGIMKVLQMAANHYCKLSPSAVPRAASILLELYFLESKK